jgi:outer membrane protein assembly factor BamB
MLLWRKWWLLGIALLVFSNVACNRRKAEREAASPETPSASAQERPVTDSGTPATAASPLDWPRFHGANNDNISPATGLLKKWPDEGPKRLWACKGIGEGFGCPSIADGSIFVSGNVKGKTAITALGLDGKIRWQTARGAAWTGTNPGARGTPTIDGDRVYHETPLGLVVCLDAKTGKKIWEANILYRFDSRNIPGGLAESVLIDGNRAICCPGGNNASVVALDKNNGHTIWAAASIGDLAAYATPVLIEHQGLRIVLAMTQRSLIGVNASTGDLLFRHRRQTPNGGNANSPLFHDGQIFISSGNGVGSEMLKLVVTGEKVSVRPVWRSKQLDNDHGGVVLLNGYLYGAAHKANEGRWVCLSWSGGAQKCAEPGIGPGSLTCAEGMLYCWNEKGEVALVPATPDGYKPVSQFTVVAKSAQPTWTHPVVCGGHLYLRNGNVLYAYDIRK